MSQQWVYDENGEGKLCNTREEAQDLMDAGTHSDHPDVKPVAKERASKTVSFDINRANKASLEARCHNLGIEMPFGPNSKAELKQLISDHEAGNVNDNT